jgi:hypothetical protein
MGIRQSIIAPATRQDFAGTRTLEASGAVAKFNIVGTIAGTPKGRVPIASQATPLTVTGAATLLVATRGAATGKNFEATPYYVRIGTAASTFNTSALTAGQSLYLAAGGGLSTTPPSAGGSYRRPVAFCARSHATLGVVIYDPQGMASTGDEATLAVRKATGTITTAQVLALNATPIELVPAPGAGYYVEVVNVHLWLDYNSAAYNGVAAGEDIAIKYDDASGTIIASVETTGFIDQTNDEHRVLAPTGTALHASIPEGNQPIVIHLLAGEVATGNSPIKFEILYRVRSLEFSV